MWCMHQMQALSSYVFIAANVILHASKDIQLRHLDELLPPILPLLTSHHHSLRGFTQVSFSQVDECHILNFYCLYFVKAIFFLTFFCRFCYTKYFANFFLHWILKVLNSYLWKKGALRIWNYTWQRILIACGMVIYLHFLVSYDWQLCDSKNFVLGCQLNFLCNVNAYFVKFVICHFAAHVTRVNRLTV